MAMSRTRASYSKVDDTTRVMPPSVCVRVSAASSPAALSAAVACSAVFVCCACQSAERVVVKGSVRSARHIDATDPILPVVGVAGGERLSGGRVVREGPHGSWVSARRASYW